MSESERMAVPTKTVTKEYETRLTPSVASAAPNDAAKHATDNPIVPTQTNPTPQVVPAKEAISPIGAEAHAVETEKKKAERREVEGKQPIGTVVPGLEDDTVWAMLRRFDKVSTKMNALL